MKIEGPNPLRTPAVRRRSATGSADSSFSDALNAENAEEAAAPPSLSATTAPTNLDGLLALQGVEDNFAEAARKRARQRAELLLNKLDMLRTDLLMGGIPRSHLVGLAQSVQTLRDQFIDPHLNQVLDDIDLRAQVELAKYDPFP